MGRQHVSCTERPAAHRDERDSLVITSHGVPNHNVGVFPMTGNAHQIQAQSYTWRIPRVPALKASPPTSVVAQKSALPQGPIGFALNGVPFYNPYISNGKDAVLATSAGYEVTD